MALEYRAWNNWGMKTLESMNHDGLQKLADWLAAQPCSTPTVIDTKVVPWEPPEGVTPNEYGVYRSSSTYDPETGRVHVIWH